MTIPTVRQAKVLRLMELMIRKMTRGQLRYREYLRSETSSTFGEWLRYERYPHDVKTWKEVLKTPNPAENE